VGGWWKKVAEEKDANSQMKAMSAMRTVMGAGSGGC